MVQPLYQSEQLEALPGNEAPAEVFMTKLTASKEHYIKAVYELDRDGEGARISDIAEKLNVTKASVCVAMKSLQQKKLVERAASRKVFLTPKGKHQAESMVNKFNLIKRFLMEVCRLDEDQAEIDACALEHVTSMDACCSMIELLNLLNKHCRHCLANLPRDKDAKPAGLCVRNVK